MRSDLPSDWCESPLRDLIRVHHGFAFKGEHFRDEPPGDVLVTPGNFAIGGGFSWAKRKYYDGPIDERRGSPHAGLGADVIDQDDPRGGQAGKMAADAAARPPV
jgi:hypothetical protein